MEELKSCKVLFKKSEEKPLGILSLRDEDKIKKDFNEIGRRVEASCMSTILSKKNILHGIITNFFNYKNYLQHTIYEIHVGIFSVGVRSI
jgi:hypothetical protein